MCGVWSTVGVRYRDWDVRRVGVGIGIGMGTGIGVWMGIWMGNAVV